MRLDALRDALMRTGASRSTRLEDLPDAEFRRLLNAAPGLILIRNEILVVTLDPKFFRDLARRYGDAADVAFFTASGLTYPYGVWPTYVEPQTDYSGCTEFGKGTLAEVYGTWRDFRVTHPHRYASRADAEIERVSREVLESTCACGDAATVDTEIRAFPDAHPRSPISSRLQERLRELRTGKSVIRFGCVSG